MEPLLLLTAKATATAKYRKVRDMKKFSKTVPNDVSGKEEADTDSSSVDKWISAMYYS